jgi:hypothetical protein
MKTPQPQTDLTAIRKQYHRRLKRETTARPGASLIIRLATPVERERSPKARARRMRRSKSHPRESVCGTVRGQ